MLVLQEQGCMFYSPEPTFYLKKMGGGMVAHLVNSVCLEADR